MIKEFFTKKENLFIIAVAALSLCCVVVGFIFLFLGPTQSQQPKTVPNDPSEIVWKKFNSDIVAGDIQYPEHLRISEREEEQATGITITDLAPREFLTYSTNQNHVSIYPKGVDELFFYGKTRQDEFTSATGQGFIRTEFLTQDDEVWAVSLSPKDQYKDWEQDGFVLIQARIGDRQDLCQTATGIVADAEDCNPYLGDKVLYDGTVTADFISLGYEILNNNTFK